MVNIKLPSSPVGYVGPAVLLAGVGVSVVKVIKAGGVTPLTQSELALFDALTVLLSVIGAIWIGQEREQQHARRLIGPHGLSAFRRAGSLYAALSRFQFQIEKERQVLKRVAGGDGRIHGVMVDMALDVFETQVGEHVRTASDAMEDWRDVIPEEIASLEREALERAAQSVESADPGAGRRTP